jgi:hypothetical protein
VPVLALAILVVLIVIALIPFSIVQRFRAGTAERPARRWVATLNLAAVAFSTFLFLGGAWVTSRIVPAAFTYTLAGLTAGASLGVAGVALTRWTYAGGRWRYTPNRLLVLTLTMAVAARLLYGFWRGWQMWHAGDSIVPGAAVSMSAGAVALGYYGVFWAGIRWRISRLATPP